MKLENCQPPLWAPNGHAQTLIGYFSPSPQLKSEGKRLVTNLADGDQLISFIYEPKESHSKTVVSIFHGLAGNSDSSYIHRSALIALEQGHTVILGNHRGCGAGAGLAKAPYHSGRGEDISAVIADARKIFPKHRHVALGFSMSANALLLLAGGQRGDILPDAAIAFNAPIDLLSTSLKLKTGFSRIYDYDLYRRCRRDVRGQVPLPYFSSLYDLDHRYTAKAAGFNNREEFYALCSSSPHLSKIKIPTIMVIAKNDPFIDFSTYKKAVLSDSIILNIQEHGGHMGYVNKSNTPLGTKRWQDYAVSEALKFLNKI